MSQPRREFLRMVGKVTLGAAALSTLPVAIKAEGEITAPAFRWN